MSRLAPLIRLVHPVGEPAERIRGSVPGPAGNSQLTKLSLPFHPDDGLALGLAGGLEEGDRVGMHLGDSFRTDFTGSTRTRRRERVY